MALIIEQRVKGLRLRAPRKCAIMLVVRIVLAVALGASLFTVRLKPDTTDPTRIAGAPTANSTPDARGVRLPPSREAAPNRRSPGGGGQPDRSDVVERGTLRLHYVQKPIGYERYEVVRDG